MYNDIVIPIGMVAGALITFINIAFMGIALHIEAMPSCKSKSGGYSWSRPFPTSVIVTIASFIIYVISFNCAMSSNTIWFVIGVTGMIAVIMLVFTSIIFSCAVISAINAKNKTSVVMVGV